MCVLGWAALVSACGSGAPRTVRSTVSPATVTRTITSAASTTSTTISSITTSSTPSAASTTSAGSAPTPASGAIPMCLTSDLTLVSLGGSGATGHSLLAFGLRNRSAHACTTGGYPGVLLLDAAGRGLATVPDHTTHDFFGETRLRELTLAPGGLASFRLGVSDVSPSGSGTGCVSVHGLQVIAPNDTASVDVSRVFEACSATVSVSPVQAGTAALR